MREKAQLAGISEESVVVTMLFNSSYTLYTCVLLYVEFVSFRDS